MIGAGIAVDLDVGPVLERIAQGGDAFRRHPLVEFGAVEHHRAFDTAGLAEQVRKADAVERDRDRGVEPGGGQVGELAAEAEPHEADIAGAFRKRAHRIHRRADVGYRQIDVEAFEIAERRGEFLLGVAELDPRLQSPEQVRCEDDIAFLGEIVGRRAHGRVDAENLLAEHETRPGTRFRYREVSVEPPAIAGGDLDRAPCHVLLSGLT